MLELCFTFSASGFRREASLDLTAFSESLTQRRRVASIVWRLRAQTMVVIINAAMTQMKVPQEASSGTMPCPMLKIPAMNANGR